MTENEIKGLREGNEKRKVKVDMKVDYTLLTECVLRLIAYIMELI